MNVLVVGASGATGKLVVNQLLIKDCSIKIVVRSTANIPESWKNNEQIEITVASILELTDNKMLALTKNSNAIVSCLGHNLTFKGIYGKPRRLVTDTARRLCNAIKSNSPEKITKYILMNTSGNQNRDLNEPISFSEKCVIGLLRLLLPPHLDNEKAADYLLTQIGQSNKLIQWVAVRPDGLIDLDNVTEYEIYPSPIRSAIFNAGKTSRINVANFMTNLIYNDNLWNKWKGQMPVIYNK